MLLARDTSVAVEQAWNVEWGWRWMFWAETLPAALFLVMSFFIPESPVYLQLKAAKDTQREDQQAGLKELFQHKYGRILLLGLVIAVFQQWCGTKVSFNDAQEIFVGAGFDVDGMFIDIVITGIASIFLSGTSHLLATSCAVSTSFAPRYTYESQLLIIVFQSCPYPVSSCPSDWIISIADIPRDLIDDIIRGNSLILQFVAKSSSMNLTGTGRRFSSHFLSAT